MIFEQVTAARQRLAQKQAELRLDRWALGSELALHTADVHAAPAVIEVP